MATTLKKRKKKSMTDEETLLDMNQTRKQFLEFVKQEKKTQLQNSTSQLGNKLSKSSTPDIAKHKPFKPRPGKKNEKSKFGTIEEFSAVCPKYQKRIDKFLQHQDPIEPVEWETFERLAFNLEYASKNPNKRATMYSEKSVEEAIGALQVQQLGYMKNGTLSRMSHDEFFRDNYNPDFVLTSPSSPVNQTSPETQTLSAHEFKAGFPITNNETIKQMGARVTIKGVQQCENTLKANASYAYANLYINHVYLNDQQSLELSKGVESVEITNPNINVFQFNNKR